jgi:hypothetical protein
MQIFNGELFLRKGKDPLHSEMSFLGNIPLIHFDYAYGDINCKIYQVVIKENNMFIRYRNSDGQMSGLKKIAKEELERDMIPLTTFLSNAEYIGKYATISHELGEEKNNSINGIILYKNPEFMIIYDTDLKINKNVDLPIRVIDKRSYVDVFIRSENTNKYSDPKTLYHDLFMETLKTTKEMNNKNKGKQK